MVTPEADTSKLVLCWCAVWVLVHYLAWPIWIRRGIFRLICSPTPVERYRRRLCRSQVYCACAVMGGFRLLLSCKWSAMDLLYAYSAEHQVLFSMAVGHWLVAVWEDALNWTFLKAGLTSSDTQGGVDPSLFLWQAYLIHHLLAALAFAGAMQMKVCTGLAAFGLIFELPVLYMNHREFIVFADHPVEWFRDIRQVDFFWGALLGWFGLARGIPSLVYVYSLVFWSEDLGRLSEKEALLYHGMAIFFTFLNVALLTTFLGAWQRKDFEVAGGEVFRKEPRPIRKLLTPEEEAEAMEKNKQEEEQSIAPDMPEAARKPLKQVTSELLASKVQGEEGQLWLEIDNVVYDLTEFLGKHPGGDTILRQFVGKDASKAFHKAKHSMQAKMQMQMYCVGPLKKEVKEYRLFEHIVEERNLLMRFLQVAFFLGASCWLMPYSWYPAVRSLQRTPSQWHGLLCPGLALTVTCASLLLPARHHNPAKWSRGALYFAAFFTAFLTGLELARRPIAEMPSGLEIGAVTIFVVEEIIIHMTSEGWTYLYWRRLLLAGAFVLMSWSSRGVGVDVLSPEHVLAGLLIGISIPALCRLTSRQAPEVVMEQALQGLALISFVGWPLLIYMLMPEAGIRALARQIWALWTLNTLISGLLCSLSVVIFVAALLNDACDSAALASRSVAFMLSFAVAGSTGVGTWRWLCLAFFTMLGTLGHRNNAVLDDLQKKGKLAEVPAQKIGARSAWEMFYLQSAGLLWQFSQGLVKFIINMLMPQELRFYAAPLPIFELGEDVDVGVAAYYAPKEAFDSNLGPRHFVCSVAHMDMAHSEGEHDLQVHQNKARDMWMKCKDTSTSAAGFIANVNCFFPRLSGSTHCKEINLSGWTSSEAAEAFSAQLSGSHQLQTFGGMQAILKTHGDIRHQDRCSNCGRLSESELGQRAPERCKYCGKKNFGYPFF